MLLQNVFARFCCPNYKTFDCKCHLISYLIVCYQAGLKPADKTFLLKKVKEWTKNNRHRGNVDVSSYISM